MRETVLALPVGGLSERIDAAFGCGVVQLVEKRSFVPKTFEQAREGLFRQLFDERLAEEYKKLVERLRAQTYIERKGVFGDRGIRRSSAPASPDPGF
jgi:parvulin-like peptidyl-prolyl isomerase